MHIKLSDGRSGASSVRDAFANNRDAVDGCIRKRNFMRLLYQNNSPYAIYAIAFQMISYMEEHELDAPLAKWKTELIEANEALMERLCDKPKKIGLKDQSRALLKCVVNIRRLVESFLYSGDAGMAGHAQAVNRVLKSYMGLGRLSAASKITYARLIMRDLSTPEMMPHVEAIPELTDRLLLLDKAKDDMEQRQLEMVYADVDAENRKPLQGMKRNVAQVVNKTIAYLEAMANVDADAYGPMLSCFQYILNEDNDARKRAYMRKQHKTQENQDASTVKMTKSVAEKKDEGLDAEIVEG